MEITYEPGSRDPSELQEFVEELLQELRDGGLGTSRLNQAGPDSIRFRPSSS
jgi:hypothetical protein